MLINVFYHMYTWNGIFLNLFLHPRSVVSTVPLVVVGLDSAYVSFVVSKMHAQ